jgi:signal transduction histidine kinase
MRDSMSNGMMWDVPNFIKNLNEHLIGNGFEKVMLSGVSTLFHSSSVSFAYVRRTSANDQICLFEISGDTYREELITASAFRERFGFNMNDAMREDESQVEGLASCLHKKAISYTPGSYHCLLIIGESEERSCLSEERLALVHSLIELSLNARYTIKEIMCLIELEIDGVAISSHRMKNAIASIRTAFEMYMTSEFTEHEKNQLKELAFKGIAEFTSIIDEILEVSRLKEHSMH